MEEGKEKNQEEQPPKAPAVPVTAGMEDAATKPDDEQFALVTEINHMWGSKCLRS